MVGFNLTVEQFFIYKINARILFFVLIFFLLVPTCLFFFLLHGRRYMFIDSISTVCKVIPDRTWDNKVQLC